MNGGAAEKQNRDGANSSWEPEAAIDAGRMRFRQGCRGKRGKNALRFYCRSRRSGGPSTLHRNGGSL